MIRTLKTTSVMVLAITAVASAQWDPYPWKNVPLKPQAQALYNERIANNGKDHPGASCLPSGIPEKDNIPDGLKLVQTEDLTLLLHESRTIYRQIFTDGRPLPKDPQPT